MFESIIFNASASAGSQAPGRVAVPCLVSLPDRVQRGLPLPHELLPVRMQLTEVLRRLVQLNLNPLRLRDLRLERARRLGHLPCHFLDRQAEVADLPVILLRILRTQNRQKAPHRLETASRGQAKAEKRREDRRDGTTARRGHAPSPARRCPLPFAGTPSPTAPAPPGSSSSAT